MAQIKKIEEIPEEIRRNRGKPGREKSPETQAFAALEVGGMLQIDEPDATEMMRIRKRLETYARKNKDRVWRVSQRRGILYVERVK